jgi:hypothetical protein
LPGLADLSQDEEGPVGIDFDADLGILDVFEPELGFDVEAELDGREAERSATRAARTLRVPNMLPF